MSAAKHDPDATLPPPDALAAAHGSTVDLMSRFHDRYRDLLDGLIPVASRSLSRTREETHEALQQLVDRALGGRALAVPGPEANISRNAEQGRDR